MSDQNHAETIRDLTLESIASPVSFDVPMPTDGKRQFIALPTEGGGFDLKDITPQHTLVPPKPTFISQTVALQDQASLEAYVNRFKNADTMILADMKQNSISAFIDYHRAPVSGEDAKVISGPSAELLRHSAIMTIPFSEEWSIWTKIDGQLMPQLAFCRFLEENALDVIAPATADLIEVCRDIQGLRQVEFTSVVRTNSNNAEKFNFSDNSGVKGKGDIDIPREFKLEIPVYFNDRAYEVRAFLRNEIEDGKLRLGIKLHRPEYIRQTAFRNIMAGVAVSTGISPLFGSTATPR